MRALVGILVLPLTALAFLIWLESLAGRGEGSAATFRKAGAGWLEGVLFRLRPWQVVAAVALTCLVLAGVVARHGGPYLALAGLLAGVLFARVWVHSFVELMSSPDEAFPGRHDKLVWVLLLVFLPPVGLVCLRDYRRRTAAAWKASGTEAENRGREGLSTGPSPLAYDDLF
ncbi:MAG: hypothetical protein U0835_26095 [Isosphaeraceae bacterium]